jgi:MFS transporter, SP family, sugar:H+ symporter
VASFVGERFGRRVVFVALNSICMVGTAICYSSQTYGQILAGRMIIQMHTGMQAWLVPMFQAEIVPAAIRGLMVSLYVFNHIFATFISSIVTNFTSKYDGDSSWKVPIICMFTFPAFCLLLQWGVPESPRWLLRRGQRDEAIRNLEYLNNGKPGFVAEDHIQLLQEALDSSTEKGRWKDLFKGVNRVCFSHLGQASHLHANTVQRRTAIACIAAASSQLTGQSFASTYGAIFIQSINVMDTFTATLIKRGILCLGPIVVLLTIEPLGRRRLFFIFGSLSAVSLITMGALGSVMPDTLALKKGIVAMAIFFPFCYISSFGSV